VKLSPRRGKTKISRGVSDVHRTGGRKRSNGTTREGLFAFPQVKKKSRITLASGVKKSKKVETICGRGGEESPHEKGH